MSDSSSADNHQPTRARRVHPKARRAASRRANTTGPGGAAQNTDDLMQLETEEPGENHHSEPLNVEASDTGISDSPKRLTPLTKQILIWGGIAGFISFLFSLATVFVFDTFGSTQAQANQNAGLLEGAYCLSFIVPLALAFFAGLRATAREGIGRYGGAAGLWSVVVTSVLGVIYTAVYVGVTSSLQSLNGAYWLNFGENLVLEGVLGFGAGYFGGWSSNRQRLRAQQRQEEALPSSS
jgi:hypothetical protein